MYLRNTKYSQGYMTEILLFTKDSCSLLESCQFNVIGRYYDYYKEGMIFVKFALKY